MKFLFAAAFAAFTLMSGAYCADSSVAWCYHLPHCNDTNWPTIAPQYCNGSRQSPIDIVSASAKGDSNLTAFTFYNYSSKAGLVQMNNTGKTVKITLASGIKISGGDLPENYDSLQFHLHWGNGSDVPGSEHTVDGKRYPMELHIVNKMSSKTVQEALEKPNGLAALGFFIEAKSGSDTGYPAAWKNLTDYLANITQEGEGVDMTTEISLDDILHGVDRTKYYRYMGSLTTPKCNEAVVWTVFKESIKVSKDLIDLFSTMLHVHNSSSPLMINVYRNIQPEQPVTTQVKVTNSGSTTYGSLLLLALSLLLGGGW